MEQLYVKNPTLQPMQVEGNGIDRTDWKGLLEIFHILILIQIQNSSDTKPDHHVTSDIDDL